MVPEPLILNRFLGRELVEYFGGWLAGLAGLAGLGWAGLDWADPVKQNH